MAIYHVNISSSRAVITTSKLHARRLAKKHNTKIIRHPNDFVKISSDWEFVNQRE